VQQAGVQLQVGFQQVAGATSSGGAQVQLALQSTAAQTGAAGAQTASGIQTTGAQTTQALGTTATGVAQTGGQLVNAIGSTAAGVGTRGGFGGVLSGLTGGGTLTDGIAGNTFSGLASAFTSPGFIIGGLGAAFTLYQRYKSNKKNKFAEGGYIDPAIYSAIKAFREGGSIMGPGTGTSDDILAWLSNGEFVVNAKDTSNYRDLLEAMNNGADREDLVALLLRKDDAPKFATGGLVSSSDLGSSNLGDFRDFGFLGSKVEPVTPPLNAGQQNTTISPTYNITIQGGDQKSADRFARSAAQHAKELGRFIERAKRNT
jgi:hypothetical protein